MAVETREYRAEAKFQRVSPQKARLVLDLIKGRGVEEALTVAAFTKKRIAPVIHKLLTSAVDNAKYVAGEQGVDLDVDNLYVKTVLANDGPRMKRIRPAPMGRAYRYQRRLTHIVLTVAEREAAHGMVTKVEEPPAVGQTSPAAPKVSKAAKATPKVSKAAKAATKKASKAKAEAPKAAKAEEHKATKAKTEAPKTADKSTKKKAGK
ncbi:MAG: 50S ribosomal protein L22 [Terracidiphilus sp.]|jgi:large subunit ribosomal protein L22